MQFKLLAATLLASTGLCAATPLTTRQGPAQPNCSAVATSGPWIWKVNNLTARKLDGESINSLSFDAEGTKGNFATTCVSNTTVLPGKLYPCNDKSELMYAFQGDRSGLLLYQVWNDVPIIGSATTLMTCEHGPGDADWICKSNGDSFLSMVEVPAPLSKSTA